MIVSFKVYLGDNDERYNWQSFQNGMLMKVIQTTETAETYCDVYIHQLMDRLRTFFCEEGVGSISIVIHLKIDQFALMYVKLKSTQVCGDKTIRYL